MKRTKKILFYVLALFIICSAASAYSMNVHAQTDVTATISSKTKKKMNTIANKFLNMSTYYLSYVNKNCGASKTFNFSKKSDRKFFIKYSGNSNIRHSASKQNTYSKQLFGKSVPKVTVLVGDWGCEIPVCSITQIYKISSKKYAFTCNLYMLDDSTPKVSKLIGTETFYVTKSSKAKYGFYVTKLVVTDIGIIGTWSNPDSTSMSDSLTVTFDEYNKVTVSMPRDIYYGTYSVNGNQVYINLTYNRYYSNVSCRWYNNASYRQSVTGTISGYTLTLPINFGYGVKSYNLNK